MKYHMLSYFFGFILDLILGDPYYLPHPIRLIGKLISGLEKILLGNIAEKNEKIKKTEKSKKAELIKGIILAVTVPILTALVVMFILAGSYCLNPIAGIIVETIMTYQILAIKCLKIESMKVYRFLKAGNLEDARGAVSMIVGRDTKDLDEEGVAKAAIETVAENTSDGVIAPMIYTAIGGPVLGFFYKAVNTMDSMVGYKNDKYLYFGRAAAKFDDFMNYIPARISAYFMILAAFCGGEDFSINNACYIYGRDKRNHSSPNSAQTEAVCAGALGIRLAGDAVYFGQKVKKPYIGDALRKVEYEDIRRCNTLMYLTAWIGEVVCLFIIMGMEVIFTGIV